MRADLDGQLRIRTQETVQDESVHDVVDRSGRRIARVLLPRRSSIVGFGIDGTIFIAADTNEGVRLERARFRLRP
ncbi:MAG: hypothetical protein ACREL7_00585 [Longimicrobiales bacterium]